MMCGGLWDLFFEGCDVAATASDVAAVGRRVGGLYELTRLANEPNERVTLTRLAGNSLLADEPRELPEWWTDDSWPFGV